MSNFAAAAKFSISGHNDVADDFWLLWEIAWPYADDVRVSRTLLLYVADISRGSTDGSLPLFQTNSASRL